MKTRLGFVLFILFTTLSAPVYATTYWVAATGGSTGAVCADIDGAGDPGVYFRTVVAGAACLVAGDTLRVKSGTYAEALLDPLPSGLSASQPTTLEGDPAPNWPVLRPTTSTNRTILAVFLPRSNIRFKNFVLDGSVFDSTLNTGTRIEAAVGSLHTNITLENCEVIGGEGDTSHTAGIVIGEFSTGVVVRNCSIHGWRWFQTDFGAHGLYWRGDNGLIENNEIYDNYGNGLQFCCNGNVNNNIFRNNYVHDNSVPTNTSGNGLYFAGGTGNQAYNNIFAGNETGVWFTAAGTKNHLWNNVMYNNLLIGIRVTGGSGTIRNNIMFNNPSNLSQSGTGTVVLSNNRTTDPSFINAAGGNFNLLEGSPAIDAGTTTICAAADVTSGNCAAQFTIICHGSTCDQGAYEAPLFSSCVVEDGDATKVRNTFVNSAMRATAMQGSAAANWAVVVAGVGATETAVTHVGSTRTDVTLSAGVTVGQSVTVAYTRPASTALSNNSLIGDNDLGAQVRTFSAQVCTNNVAGAPTATFDQLARWGFYEWRGTQAAASQAFGVPLDTAATLHGESCFAFRGKVECNGSACQPKSFATFFDRNSSGTFVEVPNTAGADLIRYGACPDIPHGTATTERLTSGAGAYVAGQVRGVSSSTPPITLAQDAETELVDCICLANATVGDTYRLRYQDQDGAALSSYPSPLPTLTVGQRKAVWK